jgi:protein-S-isoprenylcysteine O-methyltransferase Ste14
MNDRLIDKRVMLLKKIEKETLEAASPKYWVGIIITHVLISITLFLSGWDLGWWQAWLYSLLLMAAGIGPRFWAEERHPGLMAERASFGKNQDVKSWDKILAPLMAVSLTFPLVIVAGLDHRFAWSAAYPTWVNVVGFTLIVLGYAFAGWALIENRYFSSVVRIQKDRGHEVCDSGPYRFVRHPGYAGNVLALPGIILALGSVWTIIPVILALIIAIVRTMLEDGTLQKELVGYRDYVSRVPYRLIPFIF